MKDLSSRYNRNMMTLSPAENQKLREQKVCVIGCGGLGGFIIEELGRLGVGTITAVDGDVFDPTNLNRQLLSTEALIGQGKAEAARDRMAQINSEVHLIPVHSFVTAENCAGIIRGHDVVVDALDNIPSRKLVEQCCQEEGIPLVHGAIAGWNAQVATILPGKSLLSRLYPEESVKGIETELGNPSFTPALAASIQVSEVVKLLVGRGELLDGKLLVIDLLSLEFELLAL